MEAIDIAIDYLLKANAIDDINYNVKDDKLRALMNITMPTYLPEEYYYYQDLALQRRLKHKEIIDVNDLKYESNISIYKGDITLLKADAIVNACNKYLLGCFSPLHSCIDNAIHSFGGLQIRRDLMEIMKTKEYEENGKCEVTKAYNLPSKYVFHTVGPIIEGRVTKEDVEDLRNCYISCLKKAVDMKLQTIVFCSISTGVYNFPIMLASKIAIETILEFQRKNKTNLKIILDVFSEKDYKVYEQRFREIIK